MALRHATREVDGRKERRCACVTHKGQAWLPLDARHFYGNGYWCRVCMKALSAARWRKAHPKTKRASTRRGKLLPAAYKTLAAATAGWGR